MIKAFVPPVHKFYNVSVKRRKNNYFGFLALGFTFIASSIVLSNALWRTIVSDHFGTRHNNGLNIKYYHFNHQYYDRPNSNRIYFHESTKRAQLNDRQSCVVESAAKNNPDKPVQLFMLKTEEFDFASPWLKILSQYPNIEIILIDEEEYFRETPLEAWYHKGVWRSSPYKHVHLSDYLRMLSAFKGGGLYLDMDMLTLKPFDSSIMASFFSLEDENALLLCNSVFYLESTHRFIEEIIQTLASTYNPTGWGTHGGDLIGNIMTKHCGLKLREIPVTNTCEDIQLFPHYKFLPLYGDKYEYMFRLATNYSISALNQSYGVHTWNTRAHHEYIDYSSDMLYSIIAREHCPLTAKRKIECST